MKLQGKVAIVTGGAMGIGRAIAEGLAWEGASIVIADLANADQAAAEIRQKGTKAIGVKADVSSEADTTAMAQAALDAFDRIDILINNAGIFTTLKLKPFEEISVAEWRKVMDVNVMGIFLSCRAVAGSMKAQKEGRIINLASGVPFQRTSLYAPLCDQQRRRGGHDPVPGPRAGRPQYFGQRRCPRFRHK